MFSEKGAALLQVLVAGTFASALIVAISLLESNRFKVLKLDAFKKKRNDIANNLAFNLASIDNLKNSAAKNIPYRGNELLRKCLGLDYNEEEIDQSADKECNPNKWTEFLLYASQGQYYSEEQKKLCKDEGRDSWTKDPSCYFAGTVRSENVAYNFDGETGTLSAEYHLEAKVYFQAVCTEGDGLFVSSAEQTENCHVAQKVKLKYTLKHYKAGSSEIDIDFVEFIDKKRVNIKTSIGTYPSSENYIEVSRMELIGNQCNEGATLQSKDNNGDLQCQCVTPWKPKEIAVGVPAYNSKGPICEVRAQKCPPGLILVGQDENANPVCELINQPTRTWETSFSTTDPEDYIGCKQHMGELLYGWATAIKIRCNSRYGFKEDDEQGLTKEEAAGIGAGVGVGVAIIGYQLAAVAAVAAVKAKLAGTASMALLPLMSIGPAGWVVAGVILLAIAIAVLLAVLLPEKNWWQEPLKDTPKCNYKDPQTDKIPHCPEIVCHFNITCNAYK